MLASTLLKQLSISILKNLNLSLMLLIIFGSNCVNAVTVKSKTAVSMTARTCREGARINITCSFDGPPPFGATTVPSLVRFQSPTPFMALEESDLVDFMQSPTSQPRPIINNANWQLNQPWYDLPQRYSRSVRHNDTSVTFQIESANARDTGYYGCQFDSVYSVFKPLLVYANEISLNATVLIGSLSNISKIGNELEVTYNGSNTQYVELAVKLTSNYANLPFTASLFSNRSLQNYSVVSPDAELDSCQQEIFCLWHVSLFMQVVLSDAPSLHADRLSLQFAHPSNRTRILWRVEARLLDVRQPRDIVANASVTCSQPARVRVRHGQPVEVACSVPRLWLSLPGFTAYWTINSSVQFYPIGSVSCAYSADSLMSNRVIELRPTMTNPPFVPTQSACIGNRFRSQLLANFARRLVLTDQARVARVEFAYRLPAAYYVHADRPATFAIEVTEPAFVKLPSPRQTFVFEIESGETSGAGFVSAKCCVTIPSACVATILLISYRI